MNLTEKQREYIEIMLTNRFTDEKDQESLKRHPHNSQSHRISHNSQGQTQILFVVCYCSYSGQNLIKDNRNQMDFH